MRCGCYGLLLGIGLMLGGAQGTFEWFKNRSQSVVSQAQFEAQKPSGGWFEISDARLNIPGAMWMTSKYSDEKQQIYVPLRPKGEQKPGAKIHTLIEVDDAATKSLVDEVSRFDESKVSDKQILQFALKNQTRLYPTRAVSGMVKFGINDLQSDDRQKIAALNKDLAPDFVVLEENAHPNGLSSLLMLLGGSVLTLFVVAGFFGDKNAKPGASGPALPNAQSPGPQPPMSGGGAG